MDPAMIRRSSKRQKPYVPLDEVKARGGTRLESGPGGYEYTVRQVRNNKSYTCPGCGQSIPPNTPHVVAWTHEHLFGSQVGLEERRHWHSTCWKSASRRGW